MSKNRNRVTLVTPKPLPTPRVLEPDELAINDIYTVCYLRAMGVKVVRVQPGNLVRWIVDNTDGRAVALRKRYLSGEECPVDARTLFDVFQTCRREVVAYKEVV